MLILEFSSFDCRHCAGSPGRFGTAFCGSGSELSDVIDLDNDESDESDD